MSIFEPLNILEGKEELLRNQINTLSELDKKTFYKEQTGKLKDPDTYASLNWFFLGGFHHFYLGKFKLFAVELLILLVAIIMLSIGFDFAVYLLVILALFELPQLFFSQKIARQRNYEISLEILNAIKGTK